MAVTTQQPVADAAPAYRRPFRVPGQGILLANVALVLVAVVLLDVNLFPRASLSTLTPVVGRNGRVPTTCARSPTGVASRHNR